MQTKATFTPSAECAPTQGSELLAAEQFSTAVLAWHSHAGRTNLPWQITPQQQATRAGVYRVWLSEVMLQQTQVTTVIGYFSAFIARFSTIEALATASWDDVAAHWAGLGYYARARNLHAAAKQLAAMQSLPSTTEAWTALPGIGRSTAGAIMALGMGKQGVILDANVRRVLGRVFTPAGTTLTSYTHQLWQRAEVCTPAPADSGRYAQAMMDLGALVCGKTPQCARCPVQFMCGAYRANTIEQHPLKIAKTAKPTKYAHAYVCTNSQGQVLWGLRPNKGIWGGLWCLPMTAFSPEPLTAIEQATQLCQIEHVFTHFKLVLQVYSLTQALPLQDDFLLNHAQPASQYQWLSKAQSTQLALPSAMVKVLALIKL